MVLGISGASFLFGALNDWYYYLFGGIFLAVGLYFYFRRQPVAVSLESRQRNKWFFPLVMVGTAGAAYLLFTFVVPSLLISIARPTVGMALSAREATVEQGASLWQAELRVEGMT